MIFHSGPTQIPREWRYPIYHHCSLNMIPNVRYPLRRRVPSVCLSKRQLSVAVFSSSHLPSFGSDQRLNGVESEPTLLHPTRAFTKTVLLQNRHSFHVTPILCAGNDRYVPDRTIDSSCVGVTKQAYLVKQRLGFYQVDSSHKPVALVFYNKASPFIAPHTQSAVDECLQFDNKDYQRALHLQTLLSRSGSRHVIALRHLLGSSVSLA